MEYVTGGFAVAGAALIALAGFGVVRLDDLYSRMHAATKASTLGIGLVAVAGALGIAGGTAAVLLSALLIFVTAPSAAHLIGRAAYRAEGIDVHLHGRDDLRELFDAPDEAGDDAQDRGERQPRGR